MTCHLHKHQYGTRGIRSGAFVKMMQRLMFRFDTFISIQFYLRSAGSTGSDITIPNGKFLMRRIETEEVGYIKVK